MPNIQVLPQDITDKIAAGEVAERPSAVVKELVENSIDAGATSIEIEIRKGGIEYIRICDNGCGIEPNQVETAFLRHATSKLKTIDDLYRIGTMGFRGEALSSICAVADVDVITKTEENEEGVFVQLSRGKVCSKEEIACGTGTTMIVKNLFENIPARMKFLKKNSTEAGYVADVVSRIALAHPEISFTYVCDDKEVFSTSGDGVLKNVILKIYGIDHAKAVIPLDYTEDNVRVSGVIGKPEISRGNRTRQTLLVNSRYIKNNVISKIVGEAYRNSIMVGKFPFFVINLSIALDCVDVNVHPAKTEIKFSNENRIYEIVYHAVSNALIGGENYRKAEHNSEVKNDEEKYVQEKIMAEMPAAKSLHESVKPEDKIKFHTHSSGAEQREKIDKKIVKEYLDNVMPTKEEKEKLNDIFIGVNFLDDDVKKSNKAETQKDVAEQTNITTDTATERKEVVRDLPKPIAQIFDTYVLCQSDDVLYIIDQHAAHERYRFEGLKKSYYERETFSQLLLAPMIIQLDYSEADAVLRNLDAFCHFGFDIEDFGSGSIIVNATPVITSEAEIRDLILEISDALADMNKTSLAEFEERTLDMIACKYAIKANKKLNYAEMQDIIEKVISMEDKGIKTCPHGRPIKVEISKTEIEKMFKRRV